MLSDLFSTGALVYIGTVTFQFKTVLLSNQPKQITISEINNKELLAHYTEAWTTADYI